MIYLAMRSLFRHIRNTPELYGPIFMCLCLCGAGAWLATRVHRVQTQAVAPGVTSTVVETASLSSKDVAQVIGDPKDKAVIADLMAQVARLKAKPTSVVVTSAQSESTGSGKVTEVLSTPPPGPTVVLANDAPPTPAITAVHFTDYRLKFDADLEAQQATYTLSQRFETVVTTGRQADGKPLALAQLYELDAKGNRVPVPTVQTTAVFADETVPHWMRKFAVQAGVAETRAANGTSARGAIVAAQWLKHGRTSDASGVTYAVLSPAVVIAPGVTDIGILPVSVNLGRLPHQPFTNIWVSPFVAKSQRLGIAVTATF